MENKLTFVTSYFKIYEEDYNSSKSFEKRLELFLKMADKGINICIFVTPEYECTFKEITTKYKNIVLIDVFDKEYIAFSEKYFPEQNDYKLPDRRSHIKDTKQYMYLMNSKIDFVKRAIDANPFSSEYFCWIDFSIPYMFRNLDETNDKIFKLSKKQYFGKFVAMPGCWGKNTITDINYIKNYICWRFCGSFFIGDKNSLIEFYNTSYNNYSRFLKETETTLWEVNYWLWLELNCGFSPIWYPADHNDSIINIPSNLYSNVLIEDAEEVVSYDYINIDSDDKYFPSSASYVYDNENGKHILNTRYVNYRYMDNWDCTFYNSSRQIRTINMFSTLDEDLKPENYKIVKVTDESLKSNDNAFSVGLEDIRLYRQNNKIKFIATNINYIPENKIRMIMGDYINGECNNCKIINMQWETRCEKNWSPIQYDNCSRQKFIYKWSPYQIGFIDDDNNLKIEMEFKYEDIIFNKFRGSTTFIERDENSLIGVVHYSVPAVPPIYYHSLVLINKTTLLPISYSNPFKFGEKPIEFCIGFAIFENKYHFWISQMDREPILIKIDTNKIDIKNVCK